MLCADLTKIKRIFFIVSSTNHSLAQKMIRGKDVVVPIQYSFTKAVKDIEFRVETTLPNIPTDAKFTLLIIHREFFGVLFGSAEDRIRSLVASGYSVMYVTDQLREVEDILGDVNKSSLAQVLCGVAYDRDMFQSGVSFASSIGSCFIPKELSSKSGNIGKSSETKGVIGTQDHFDIPDFAKIH